MRETSFRLRSGERSRFVLDSAFEELSALRRPCATDAAANGASLRSGCRRGGAAMRLAIPLQVGAFATGEAVAKSTPNCLSSLPRRGGFGAPTVPQRLVRALRREHYDGTPESVNSCASKIGAESLPVPTRPVRQLTGALANEAMPGRDRASSRARGGARGERLRSRFRCARATRPPRRGRPRRRRVRGCSGRRVRRGVQRVR